jgi:hypothetical protein
MSCEEDSLTILHFFVHCIYVRPLHRVSARPFHCQDTLVSCTFISSNFNGFYSKSEGIHSQ